jgi:hypothetical protein
VLRAYHFFAFTSSNTRILSIWSDLTPKSRTD